MTLAYDGTDYHGFAFQPLGVPTIAGTLASALERVLRLPSAPALTCAGRTDAGVHALGQVVHLDVPAASLGASRNAGRSADLADLSADLADLERRLVKLLAPGIVVREISVAPDTWDARRSAQSRTYRYSVLNRVTPDPFLHRTTWLVPGPLDLGGMELGCDPLLGEHDFASFCRRPAGEPAEGAQAGPGGVPNGGVPDPPPLVRRVLGARWWDEGQGLLRFEISANAFCHQMVRSIVGTLVQVGLGRMRAGDITGVLRARDRAAAGPVAPPHGLCLWSVQYPDEPVPAR